MTHAEDLAVKYAYWCGRLETMLAVLVAYGATDADRQAAAATLAEYRAAFPAAPGPAAADTPGDER